MKKLLVVLAVLCVFQYLAAERTKKECDLTRIEDTPECPECDQLLEKEDIDEEGKCKKCGTTPRTVKACVKVGYVCKEDGTESFEPGKCPKCEKELSKITVKSKVIYKCPECGSTAESAGDCDICEKPRQRTCKYSGKFPHVAQE